MVRNYLLLATQELQFVLRNISLLIVATFIKENQIVEAINYIKKISKKKLSIDRLLAHINNTTANNWDREFVEDTLQYVKVPMPAHRFKSSDWSIL